MVKKLPFTYGGSWSYPFISASAVFLSIRLYQYIISEVVEQIHFDQIRRIEIIYFPLSNELFIRLAKLAMLIVPNA